MQENQNIQKSVLFDDLIPYIKTSSNNSNAVHKKFVTSTISNNSKKLLNSKKTQINAFASMSNKSLKDTYAVTGL
ncbi:MAG: hypothetical protein OQK48_07885 [Sulfurimonas sp.]|uniref:hypothetical protein n=1 Tax=Sulfurimonas sp. TaxID=2022749 RepID=UPI00262DBCCA|nr:hypothetical protein [Sulfurimonas sp.]MCW8895186.1 hypothetical protein [Sulfurimonas sp.]MCW8954853.1 hypothetical protein [Sulfurimonas sp.]MCW9068448.1 hypothetical protein [Sulfurimonas sp.]